jgi:hypothetical protein
MGKLKQDKSFDEFWKKVTSEIVKKVNCPVLVVPNSISHINKIQSHYYQ